MMVTMHFSHFPELEYQSQEAINTLCANLSFMGGDIKTIMITSAEPQEGKSFITMNLMRSMARLGQRVLLIDADIRASVLRGEYGIEITQPQDNQRPYGGLTAYLAGLCEADDILGKTSIEGAYMILAGRTVINSLPLFNSERLPDLIRHYAPYFDVILVDAPPVGALIDAAQIATFCDGVLMVVRNGKTRASELTKAIEQLKKTDRPLLGYVLNQTKGRGQVKKYYYYLRKSN